MGAIVIPASELQATDKDLNDVLYYTLEAVTLVSARPAGRLPTPGAPGRPCPG